MKRLFPTNLIAVELLEEYMNCGVDNGMQLPDGKCEMLGTVTANEITFDVEPYLRPHTTKYPFTINEEYDPLKAETTYWEYGGGIIKNVCHSGLSATESFYSLLKANGLSDFKKLLILKPI